MSELFAQYGGGYGWGMGPGMMGGYGWGGWFWYLLTGLFWIALIVGVVFLIRWLAVSSKSERHGAGRHDPALEILRKRYARGEIDKDEYESKRKDLED